MSFKRQKSSLFLMICDFVHSMQIPLNHGHSGRKSRGPYIGRHIASGWW